MGVRERGQRLALRRGLGAQRGAVARVRGVHEGGEGAGDRREQLLPLEP